MVDSDTLITGATGFVGGHLLNALGDGHRVRALVRDSSKLTGRDIDVVEGDLDDRDRTQPVAVTNVVAALEAALTVQPGSYEIAGPDGVKVADALRDMHSTPAGA